MYVRSSDFDTANPEQLRRDLQQMDRAIDAAVRELERTKAGFYKAVSIAADYTAHLGELVIANTSAGAVVVTLPIPTKDLMGQRIALTRTAGSANLTAVVPGSEVISDTVNFNTDTVREIVCDGTDWRAEW